MNFKDFFILTENIQVDFDKAFELFKAQYEKATGVSWTREKFFDRAQGWEFYGDDNGFVAVRPQKSGFYKLVGAAGSNKSKFKGFSELLKEHKPVWGMVTDEIKNLLIKMGFRGPNMIERMIIKKKIQGQVLGDAQIEGYTADGGVIIKYHDVGTMVKYFVGSPEYWKKVYSMKNLFK
jgi:hypothetical protein